MNKDLLDSRGTIQYDEINHAGKNVKKNICTTELFPAQQKLTQHWKSSTL